ncbi:hypothetical protein BMD_0914 [Priestia megaterium DSM 319]|uniref:Uncharacterized protein n=1 Tax=Priestia megaterium (strain DSM 319 / IMG 1521) TaxID=592022 RepID=D5DCF5_PRIM3|nr:hypothetical protein BMD_0914 [Priestia megaterium DSM 319]
MLKSVCSFIYGHTLFMLLLTSLGSFLFAVFKIQDYFSKIHSKPVL